MGLAPIADPSDGFFDLVTVRTDQRQGFMTYLNSLVAGDFMDLESVETRRVKKVELRWDGFAIHQDAGCIEMEDLSHTWVTLEVLNHQVEFWVPPAAQADYVLATAV